MPRPMRVTLIGLGALGILYADLLSRRPDLCALTCLAGRDRQERYARDGIFCNGRRLDLAFLAPEERPAEPAELVILGVKGPHLEQAVKDMRLHMGPGTIVISLLNGITSETVVEQAFPDALVLRCVAQGMDALRERQSLVSSCPGFLLLGCPKGRDDLAPALARCLELFAACHVPAREDRDIEHRLYAKWMLNVGLNQTCTVFEGTYGTTQVPGRAGEVCLAAMREAMAVARAEGVDLTEADLNEYIFLMDHLKPESMPSMRQDDLAGRPTEVALFAGALLDKARPLGIDAPVNVWLFKELKRLEARH